MIDDRRIRAAPEQRLSDNLAMRIGTMIQSGLLRSGDRLPTITEMSRAFRVCAPTLRQALAKLETMGLVDIRHGAGVFVSRSATPGVPRGTL